MIRAEVRPELLRWAAERSRRDPDELRTRFKHLERWEQGEAHPTLKQLEDFARATHTPIGYLFLQAPPIESIPIPDMRTIANVPAGRPSPNLLDTIYACQQRQDWYRDYTRSIGDPPLAWVGSARVDDDPIATATAMRVAMRFDLDQRAQLDTWTEALRSFIEQAEELGALVMVNGVVGNNTHRKLDPGEFRGFALADDLAPLVFVNGADTKAAQMFTLGHEMAHLWLGGSALSDATPNNEPGLEIERWCNAVAAEMLAPLAAVRAEFDPGAPLEGERDRLARRFKVSTLVVLRRLFDAGFLNWQAFRERYEAEIDRLAALRPSTSGGNFYWTELARVGRRFARAVIVSTLEGQTLYRDAIQMLGFSKQETFRELSDRLGVP
ncbi:MAG: ImmA/IrrE family metallo-endopeptidase [Dehalococcoidia bacterium]|nr:ImmA/IrrE family metallo-endopeptidase [Dehalococcoidia bacterium]